MDLSPSELRSLLTGISHALRRFQLERGLTLSWPMVSNRPLQTYFVDPDFAAVMEFDMFGQGTWTGCPVARGALDRRGLPDAWKNEPFIGC